MVDQRGCQETPAVAVGGHRLPLAAIDSRRLPQHEASKDPSCIRYSVLPPIDTIDTMQPPNDPVRDFSRAIIDLFDVLAAKATNSAQRGDIDHTRKLYAAYKEQVGAKSIIQDLTPKLIKKKDAILGRKAAELTSAETRAALVAAEPDEVVIKLYDFCVAAYTLCTPEEKTAVWDIVLAMYKACLSCAVMWDAPR